MRELNDQEMDGVSGGSLGFTGAASFQPTDPYSGEAMAAARAHLANLQSELDALNVKEHIWSSLSDS